MESDLPQIANLFLSEVRDRVQSDASAALPRPTRTPPGGAAPRPEPVPEPALRKLLHAGSPAPGLSARIIAALAPRGVALELGADGARLSLVDHELPADAADPESGSARELADALGELTSDVPLLLVGAAQPSALLLASSSAWIVTVGDGEPEMIRAYQALKTLAAAERRELILAADGPDAQPTLDRLVGVMGRFLSWQPDRTVRLSAEPAHAHPILTCPDVAACAELAETIGADAREAVASPRLPSEPARQTEFPGAPAQAEDVSPVVPEKTPEAPQLPPRETIGAAAPRQPVMRLAAADDVAAEEDDATPRIYDLDGTGPHAVVDAVLAGQPSLRPTDVPTPTAIACRVAVNADGRLTLLAAPAPEDLGAAGQLLAWATDNLQLIARSLLGITVDISLAPHLHLYLPTRTATPLARLLNPATTTAHTYLPVRWGQRRGLLLDAA